jgi:hypothetical protein
MVTSLGKSLTMKKLTKMRKKLLSESLRISRQNIHKHPYINTKWLHWSFVVSDNEIIEWGTNVCGSNPKHYGYNKKIEEVEYPCNIHSEISAYRKSKKLLGKQLNSFDIINIRLNISGETRISAPCCCCGPLLSELGCGKFYYTTNDNDWGIVNYKNLSK